MKTKTKINLEKVLLETSKLIDPLILELLSSGVGSQNKEAVKYQMSTGGKRIRPALAIIGCRLLGGKLKDVIYPAAALEILHNYTLIIDDIIDHSDFRRDKPTVWKKFGQSIAECVSVDYAAALFQGANKGKNNHLLSEIFSKILRVIVDGEILDILFERFGRENEPFIVKNRYSKVNQKDYYKMVSQKTAALIQTCCEVGGICADASQKQLQALKNYGFNLGIAFQIQDDMLDIFGEEKTFGKKIGKDIIERKQGNIVILFAMEELSQKDQHSFFQILDKAQIFNGDIKEAVKLIQKTKAKEKAQKLGQKFIQKAKQNLKLLPQNDWNEILVEIANFVIERKK